MTLLALVMAHALLHRGTRTVDAKGRIVATLADYAAVHGLVHKLFAEGVEATVPPTMRATVEAVKALGGADISIAALAKHLKLDKSNVSIRFRKAAARGFLVNRETKKGLPVRIALDDPLPEEVQVLPHGAVLRGRCGVAIETEWYSASATLSGAAPASNGAEPGKPPEKGEIFEEKAKKATETGEISSADCGSIAPAAENLARALYPPESIATPQHPPFAGYPTDEGQQ